MKRTRIKRVNRERADAARAEAYGTRAGPVRAMGCCAAWRWAEELADLEQAEAEACGEDLIAAGWTRCRGATQAAHDHARQRGNAGGDRRSLFPACMVHHGESGPRNTSQRRAFEQRYSIDITKLAADIADRLDRGGHE